MRSGDTDGRGVLGPCKAAVMQRRGPCKERELRPATPSYRRPQPGLPRPANLPLNHLPYVLPLQLPGLLNLQPPPGGAFGAPEFTLAVKPSPHCVDSVAEVNAVAARNDEPEVNGVVEQPL